ncbi:hypothetical protein ACSS6W_005887 [Trichoderma asperelloides]
MQNASHTCSVALWRGTGSPTARPSSSARFRSGCTPSSGRNEVDIARVITNGDLFGNLSSNY